MRRFLEYIPVWAIGAIVNDDYTGLTNEDIAIIKNWIAENEIYLVCPPIDMYGVHFEPVPAFGLACDCYTCVCYDKGFLRS